MLQSLFDFPISLDGFEDGVDTGAGRDVEVGVEMTRILEGKMAVCPNNYSIDEYNYTWHWPGIAF